MVEIPRTLALMALGGIKSSYYDYRADRNFRMAEDAKKDYNELAAILEVNTL